MQARRLLPVLAAALLAVRATGAASAASAWRWPLPAPHDVRHGFTPPAHDWLPGHRGVDLAAAAGAQVRAAGAGRVTFAGRVAGVGVVSVAHAGGLETTYQPLRPSVHVGEAVEAGAVIGRLGATGSHCAPAACLHWGLRRTGHGEPGYLDPLSLVGAGQVRLLPLLRGARGASWLVPAAGGASVGSSAVVLGWAVVVTRRRRRPLPPDVARLADARARRRASAWRQDRPVDRPDDGEPCR